MGGAMDAVVESMGNVALGAAAPDALPAASAGGDEAPHRGAEAAAEAGARSGRSSGGRGDGREAAEGRGERRGDERHKQEQRGGRSGGGSGVGDKPAPKDFEWGDEIGEGAFSKVVRATHRESRVVYAVKVLTSHIPSCPPVLSPHAFPSFLQGSGLTNNGLRFKVQG